MCTAAMADPPAGSNWELVWSDEFNSSETPIPPDPSNWGYENGYVRNKEEQYYTNSLQNAYCQNGYLNIEAHKHPPGTYPTGGEPGQDGSISSTSLRSMGKVSYQFGYFEIRARVDTQLGSWPAFWTLGNSGEWPDGGECDILEYYTGKFLFNVAWWKTGDPRWVARWDGEKVDLTDLPAGWLDDFHIWAMEWNTNEVKLYLDEVLINYWDSSQDDNGGGDTSVEGFQQPHYMLINQAIGGTAGGDTSGMVFPTTYEVDWVRIWQLNGSAYCGDGTCSDPEDLCNCPDDCGTPPATETVCDDGLDDDCDGVTDCEDIDCDGDPVCDFVISFYDNFESSSDWSTNWIATGAWNRVSDKKFYEGSYSAEIDGSVTDSALVSRSIDVNSIDTATITFQWLIENGLDTGEYLAFDVDTGSGWVQMADRQGNFDTEEVWAGEEIVVDVSSASTMSIRFIGNMNRSNEDAYVDLVEIITTSDISCGSGGPCGFADLANMAQHWLTIDPSADYYDDGTGIVDFKDFGVLAENWTGLP
jgi:beta-glucanase (GH16 family)